MRCKRCSDFRNAVKFICCEQALNLLAATSWCIIEQHECKKTSDKTIFNVKNVKDVDFLLKKYAYCITLPVFYNVALPMLYT